MVYYYLNTAPLKKPIYVRYVSHSPSFFIFPGTSLELEPLNIHPSVHSHFIPEAASVVFCQSSFPLQFSQSVSRLLITRRVVCGCPSVRNANFLKIPLFQSSNSADVVLFCWRWRLCYRRRFLLKKDRGIFCDLIRTVTVLFII